MESCFKFIPRKSYNTVGWAVLGIFVSIGVVIIGITSNNESKATTECNPDKTTASDLSTRNYLETECFLKYAQEFYPFLPLDLLSVINFGLVLILSIIYAVMVKHRVEIFEQQPRETANGDQDESQPLSGNMSQVIVDANEHRNSNRHIVFTVYVLHLIICRILPLVIFAVLLLNSMKFPTQFHCPWRINSMSTSNENNTQSQGRNVSNVDCTYPMGSKNEKVSATVIIINFIFAMEAFFELAYLLWSSWKDRSFVSDREFCCVYLLRKRKRIRKIRNKISENVSDEVFYLNDDFGEKALSRRMLDEIYINFIVQEGRESLSKSKRQFTNRHESYHAYLKTPKDAILLNETADLFKPKGPFEALPKTILVVGRPGIGKTLLTKKILHEWKEHATEFWHSKTVILIQFRSFNNANTNLRKILEHAQGLSMSPADCRFTYEYICSMPNDVVFIFDGLDELKYDKNSLAEETAVNDPNQEVNILQIFTKLVKGKLLPGVTVLTTSRPTADDIYNQLQFDREVEILGFQKEQIENYVKKFCGNHIDRSTKLWKLIEQSPEYLSFSYIPVNCYIICLTLMTTIDADEQDEVGEGSFQSKVPRTITELYRRAINILLFRHHNEYKDKQIPKDYKTTSLPKQLQDDLDKLKELARDGLKNDQLVLEFESGNKYAELSDCGIINKLEDKERNLFCFLHLTIQEFLAAQHVVDDMEHVEAFLIDHIDNPKWHLVIQFVAGLIGDKIRELDKKRNESKRSAEKATNDEKIIKRICNRFKVWMPTNGKIYNHRKLLLIKCVHEMQEVGVRELMTSFRCDDDGVISLFRLIIAPLEFAALFEFFGHVENLQFLNIYLCTMEHSAYRKLANLLKKENKIEDLKIVNCRISDDDAKHVIDALTNKNCKITRLDLTSNELTAKSAKYLRDALKSSNCKLTKLLLSGNELNDAGVKYLGEAIMDENCKLAELRLNDNGITENGARYLSRAVKNGNCNVTII